MRTRTILALTLLAVVLAAASTAVWAFSRPPATPGLVDPACAVTVSGSPVPGMPSMLPDGTGTCAP